MRHARQARSTGFTLLEVMVAMSIMTVIAAVIYATLSTVVNSVEATRSQAEELRLRQYLVRSLSTNFSTIYIDPGRLDETYALIGIDESGSQGPADLIRFCSTAALQGGAAIPGDLKEVRYEIASDSEEGEALDTSTEQTESSFLDDEPARMLRSIETPLLGGNVQEIDSSKGTFVPDSSYESPSWTVPIRSLNIRYFDGEEWVDDWDSTSVGRLPWCIEVRLNFARSKEQLEQEAEENFDLSEDPDMILVLPIPMGLGSVQGELNPGEQEDELEMNDADARGRGRGNGNGNDDGSGEGSSTGDGSNRGGSDSRRGRGSVRNG